MNYSISSDLPTFNQKNEAINELTSQTKDLNKAAKYFTQASSLLKISKCFFTAKFSIQILKKSRKFYDDRANSGYIPIKKETIIGCNLENSPCDILVQNSKQAQIIIRQTDSFASIYEKRHNSGNYLAARIEVQDLTQIQELEIYRIGRTLLKIKTLQPALTILISKSKSSKSDITRKFSDSFILGSSQNPYKKQVYIDDFMVCEDHAEIRRNILGWTISPLNPEFKVWKYLNTFNQNNSKISPLYEVRPGQLIQLGGNRISLVKNND